MSEELVRVDPMPTTPLANPFIEYDAEYRPWRGGHQFRFYFPNGHGASVVQHDMSYGGDQGLWELAVIDHDGTIVYDTPVTDDVLGHLDKGEVIEALRQVATLPSKRQEITGD